MPELITNRRTRQYTQYARDSTLKSEVLRVLMIAPTPYFSDRGCHVRIYEEAKALLSEGVNVRIVTYHLGRDMPGIPTFRIPPVPWYNKLSAGPSWHKPYLDILLFIKSLAEARKFKPHLIHAHLHEGAFIGTILKKILDIPLLFDCQGSLSGEIIDHGFILEKSIINTFFKRIEKYINNSADMIITSSTPLKNILVNEWLIESSRVTSIPDGVDTAFFIPKDRVASREKIGLKTDATVIGYLGIMNRYQGIDKLLQSILILKKRKLNVHFLLMGFPEEQYKLLAVEMGIADMVTFTGKIDYKTAPDYLCAADIAVSPKLSLTEANGKLYNYLACALPVIAFETPVNREIMGDDAVYAKYGDNDSLADSIERLVINREEKIRLGSKSRKRAVNLHSCSSRGEELKAVYFRMLESLPSSSSQDCVHPE